MINQLQRYAALVYAIRKGQDKYGRVGHTLIQKLFYLLTSGRKLALGYRFKLYFYGPYCPELWGDLTFLNSHGVISIRPTSKGFGYDIAPTGKEWKSLASDSKDFTLITQQIDSLLDFLGGHQVKTLEALTTTHYVYNDYKKKGILPEPWLIARSVVALKPHLAECECLDALAALKKEGLC